MAQDLHYFEDLEIGDSFEFCPLTISREEVIAFASEFDPQPFHLSDEAAAQTQCRSLLLTAGIGEQWARARSTES